MKFHHKRAEKQNSEKQAQIRLAKEQWLTGWEWPCVAVWSNVQRLSCVCVCCSSSERSSAVSVCLPWAHTHTTKRGTHFEHYELIKSRSLISDRQLEWEHIPPKLIRNSVPTGGQASVERVFTDRSSFWCQHCTALQWSTLLGKALHLFFSPLFSSKT